MAQVSDVVWSDTASINPGPAGQRQRAAAETKGWRLVTVERRKHGRRLPDHILAVRPVLHHRWQSRPLSIIAIRAYVHPGRTPKHPLAIPGRRPHPAPP